MVPSGLSSAYSKRPLGSKLPYTFANDPEEANTIDFTAFKGVGFCSPEVVVTPSNHLDDNSSPSSPTKAAPASPMATSVYRFANSTSPVILVVSSDDRCSVVARFFAFRLYHYFRCSGESVRMLVAAENFHEHCVIKYSERPEEWAAWHQKVTNEALAYFDSNPTLGFAATPVAIIYGDTISPGALEHFVALQPKDRPLLRRHIWFTEKDSAEELTQKDTCGWIHYCLSDQFLRFNCCHGSVVCSQVTFFLNTILPALQRVYLHEPLDGHPLDTLRSFAPIFFIRHGQSEYNLEDRLGGNPDLTDAGREDAGDIAVFFDREVKHNPKLFARRDAKWDRAQGFEVWCSQLNRTRNTARPSAHVLTNGKVRMFKSLNEIHAGICEDMTNEEISLVYPYIQRFRTTDKVGFRYPNGESYRDLVRRLTPLVLDLSITEKCTLVVGHQAVLRSVLSFFGGPPVEKAVHEPCPQRAIWVCTFNRVGEPQLCEITLPPRTKNAVQRPIKGWSGW